MRRAAIAVGTALLLTGCSAAGSLAKVAGSASTTASSTPSVDPLPTDPPSTVPSDTPTPTPEDLTGPVGTTYTDTETSTTDGTSTEYSVTLTKVNDPAKGAPYETPDKGSRFIAARFTIKGVGGVSSGNANTNAVLIGTDQQTYQPDFSQVRDCTNFNSGDFKVTPGHQSIGCVVFQLPKGVLVAEVQWGNSFSDAAPATWKIR